MNRREARRLALTVIVNEIEGSLDASDEWASCPEGTGREYSVEEIVALKREGRAILAGLVERLGRLNDGKDARSEANGQVANGARPEALLGHHAMRCRHWRKRDANEAAESAFYVAAPGSKRYLGDVGGRLRLGTPGVHGFKARKFLSVAEAKAAVPEGSGMQVVDSEGRFA